MKKLALVFSLVFSIVSLQAQLSVQTVDSLAVANFVDSLVRHVLVDSTITVESVSFSGNAAAVGYFSEPGNALGATEGIILGTGRVEHAATGLIPPNFGTSFSLQGNDDIYELMTLSSGISYLNYDPAIITIDFKPHADTLGLEYLFASFDYGTLYECGNFADQVGIFLSGLGVSGPYSDHAINVAEVPGREGILVSYNTINGGIGGISGGDTITEICDAFDPLWRLNSIFYAGPNDVADYNGYTKILPTTAIDVFPQMTYRLKIIIADVGDNLFDSAIFIKAGSLTSNFSFTLPQLPSTDTLFIDSTICTGIPFELPDQSLYPYNAGINQDTLTLLTDSVVSTVYINLTVIPPLDTYLEFSPCVGDTIIINDEPITRDTFWVESLQGENGCDSLVVYDVMFRKVNLISLDAVDTSLCPEYELQIIYGTDFIATENLPYTFIQTNFDSLPLPEFTEVPIETILLVDSFPDNTVVESVDQLQICVNMEHSWMHDLEINLECPNGQTVRLQNQKLIGNEVHLGVPINADDNEVIPGVGYTYCWIEDAERGTWTVYSQMADTLSLGAFPLPPGDYAPMESFDGLLGCPLNGTWTLSIEDKWNSDNGFLFNWSIALQDSILDVAVADTQGWLPSPDADISGDTLSFMANEPGFFEFTYILQDTNGCTIDTTYSINVWPDYDEQRDTVICIGNQLFGQQVDTSGNYSFGFTSINGCDSLISYQVSLVGLDTTMLSSTTCLANEAGIFVEAYTNSGGCDSTVILEVQFAPTVDTTFLFDQSCNVNETGIFTEYLTTTNGCDSILITEVEYVPLPDTTTQVRYTCDPAIEDEYIAILTSEGCDSIILIDYVFEALDYNLVVTADTCQQGMGSIVLNLGNNPNFNDISAQLFQLAPLQEIGTGFAFTDLPQGAYQLNILADETCEIVEDIVIINMGGGLPAGTFTSSSTGNTVDFAADESANDASFLWTFGDGSTANGQEVIHDFDYPGLYESCLTVENLCGTNSSCDTLFLASQIINEAVEGMSGQSVTIPVTSTGFYQLAALDLSYQFTNSNILQIESLVPDALADEGVFDYTINAVDGSIQIDWATANNPGMTIEEADTLFVIHLLLTGLPGESSELEPLSGATAHFFLGGVLSDEYTLDFSNLEVTIIAGESEITGLVQTAPYHNDPHAPIANVEANLEAAAVSIATDMTDASGQYAFTAETDIDYRIFFEKGNDDLNGLTTLGILRLLRHLAGVVPFTNPYQIIAADVDCNEVVNLDDASTLQELLLGNASIPLCESWVFVPGTYEFPVPTNPFPFPQDYDIPALNQSTFEVPPFYGIKVGDVLGESAPERPVLADSLILTVNNQTALAGDTIELTFSTIGFELLTGFQMEIQFDTMMLEWVDAEAMGDLSGYSNADFGLGQIESGLFRNLWFTEDLQPATLEDGSQLFTIRLKAKADIEEGLEPLVTFFAENLAPEAYDANFERIDLLLRFDMLNAVEVPSSAGLQLFQNQPNPFGTETLIPFYLPQSSEVELIITDALGRVISRYQQRYSTGFQQYKFEPQALPSGVYYYTLRTSYGWATRKMVLSR